MVAQLPQIWLVLRSAIWDTPRTSAKASSINDSGANENSKKRCQRKKKERTARRQWVREKQSRLDDDDEMVWDQATAEHGTRRMLTKKFV